MSLRTQTYARGRYLHILTACPVCEYSFDENERRHKHLSEHDPADFGLTPAGEIADDHDKPLFGGDDR